MNQGQHAIYTRILLTASTRASNARQEGIPKVGQTIWACNLGDSDRSFSKQEIRLLPEGGFVVGTVHNHDRHHRTLNGQSHVFGRLADAAIEAVQQLAAYYREARAEQLDSHSEPFARAA